jgi:hypothetical protein
VKRILKGIALTTVILLFCGDIGAPAGETVHLANGGWQPFLSKDVPHHGFASFSDDATALEDATRDMPSGELARLSCRAS